MVCLDIGGGSLELVSTTGAAIQQLLSLPLGAVRLKERFVHSDPINKADWKALRDHIRGELERAMEGEGFEGAALIGSGGTFSSLARVIAHQRGDKITRVHGYVANRSAVRRAIDLFRSVDLAGRKQIEGLSPEQQQVLTLKFVFNFTNGEVAGILGKTEGAIKSLQHRALVSLQKQLESGSAPNGS